MFSIESMLCNIYSSFTGDYKIFRCVQFITVKRAIFQELYLTYDASYISCYVFNSLSEHTLNALPMKILTQILRSFPPMQISILIKKISHYSNIYPVTPMKKNCIKNVMYLSGIAINFPINMD